MQRALKDECLVVILEVIDLQEELSKQSDTLHVVEPAGGGELVLDPLLAEPAGERLCVTPPHSGHTNCVLVVGRGKRADMNNV